jgi:predicted transcriptional regulator
MWVKDYMLRDICTISPDKTIAETVKFLVKNKTNSAIVVDEDRKPIGIISSYLLVKSVVPPYLHDDPIYSQYGVEGLFERYAEKAKNKKVEKIMYKDIHILSEDDAMIEAASYSVKAVQRTLPVVNKEGELVGAITRTCIKNALHNAFFKNEPINPFNGGNGYKYSR